MTKKPIRLRKICAVILAAVMCIGSVVTVSSVPENNDGDEAVITFTKYFQTKNVSSYAFKAWGQTYYNAEYGVVKDGREGVRFKRSQNAYNLYINVDDRFIEPNPEGMDVRVEVDYFDEGTDGRYGNTKTTSKTLFGIRYATTTYVNGDTEPHYIENTGKWRTAVFILKDAIFDNSMEGAYDLNLSEFNRYGGNSATDIVFGEIRITPLPERALAAEVTTDYDGNIFDAGEAKEFKLALENRRPTEVNAKIKAEAIEYFSQEVVASAEKEVTVDKNLDTSITIDFDKCGSYTVRITLDCTDKDGYNRVQTIEKYFSVMSKFKNDEPHNDFIGISAHFSRFYGQNQFYTSLMQEGDTQARKAAQIASYIGVGYVRTDWSEKTFESEPGVRVENEYSGAIDLLSEYNLKAYPILYPFSAAEAKKSDEALQKFVDFCVEEVTKHKDVTYFELMNEVNSGVYSPEQIVRIYKAVYPAVKKARPDAQLMGLALAGKDYAYMEKFYSLGGGDYIDGLSIHYYDRSPSGFKLDWWYPRIDKMIDVMKKYGQDKKPLWFGEQGWSTNERDEWSRAVSVVKYPIFLKGEGYTDCFMIYNYVRKNEDRNDYEGSFGMLRPELDMVSPLTPYPMCSSLNGMNRMMMNTEAVDKIQADNQNKLLYRFKYTDRDDNMQIICGWNQDPDGMKINGPNDKNIKSIYLNLGTDTVKEYDMYSNEIATLHSDDGIFCLPLSDDPHFFKGVFTKFEEVEPKTEIKNNVTAAVGDRAELGVISGGGEDVRVEVDGIDAEIEAENGKVLIKCTEDMLGINQFTMRVWVGGELRFDGDTSLTVTYPIQADMQFKPLENDEYKGTLTLKNISSETVSAAVNIELPDYNYNESNTNRAVELKPGEQKDYEVRLPKLQTVGVVKTNINIKMNNGYSFTLNDSDTLMIAKYAYKKPKIDGSISNSEWTGGWFGADSYEYTRLDKLWNGPDDLSFRTNLMWDEENLYLAVDVTDDVYTQNFVGGEVYRQDSLQMGFNIKPVSENDYDYRSLNQLTFAKSNDDKYTVLRVIEDSGMPRGSILDKVGFAVSRKGNHTVYEIKIPWKEALGEGVVIDENSVVNYGLIVNDADGSSERGYIYISDGIGYGQNIYEFTPLTLIK